MNGQVVERIETREEGGGAPDNEVHKMELSANEIYLIFASRDGRESEFIHLLQSD